MAQKPLTKADLEKKLLEYEGKHNKMAGLVNDLIKQNQGKDESLNFQAKQIGVLRGEIEKLKTEIKSLKNTGDNTEDRAQETLNQIDTYNIADRLKQSGHSPEVQEKILKTIR